mmetsp:Transcript_31162/g.35481  ORF Transcript_31162/g.35481 Transcript_31162/m.35481 type:complete len:88 (-) Transcript_31162:61-324(-)
MAYFLSNFQLQSLQKQQMSSNNHHHRYSASKGYRHSPLPSQQRVWNDVFEKSSEPPMHPSMKEPMRLSKGKFFASLLLFKLSFFQNR